MTASWSLFDVERVIFTVYSAAALQLLVTPALEVSKQFVSSAHDFVSSTHTEAPFF